MDCQIAGQYNEQVTNKICTILTSLILFRIDQSFLNSLNDIVNLYIIQLPCLLYRTPVNNTLPFISDKNVIDAEILNFYLILV